MGDQRSSFEEVKFESDFRERNWQLQRPRGRKILMCAKNSKEASVTRAEGEKKGWQEVSP